MNLSRLLVAISIISTFTILVGCGTAGQTAASTESKIDSEPTSAVTTEAKSEVVSTAAPEISSDVPIDDSAEADGITTNKISLEELETLCAEGKQTFVWQIDESAFDVTENVATWSVSETSEEYYDELFDSICKAMFPDVAVTEGKNTMEQREYILSNGVSAHLFRSSLELRVTDEEAFSEYSDESLEDMLVPTLSECVGLECRFSGTNDVNGYREYYFVLNEISLTTRAYSYGSGDYDVIGGSEVWFSKTLSGNEQAGIHISYLPTAQAETISSENYLSVDEIEAICRADMVQYGDQPWSIVFEQATLEYYCSHVSKQLTPCWIITGREFLKDLGWSSFSNRLVDAVTGELNWA